jgi:hypothetical protein
MEPNSNFLETVLFQNPVGAGLLPIPDPSGAVVIAVSVKLAAGRVETLDLTEFGYILACIFVTNLSRVKLVNQILSTVGRCKTTAWRNSHLFKQKTLT